MPMVVLTIAILIGASTPQYKEYAKHSNGNAAYSFSYTAPCQTGLRDSGYALAPARFVLFKQRPLDNTATGPVCDN